MQQAEELNASLRRAGMTPLTVPMLETVRVSKLERRAVIDKLIACDSDACLVFTSANGVRYLFDCMGGSPDLIAKAQGLRSAAIGEKTAAAAEDAGLRVDFVSNVSNSEALAVEFAQYAERVEAEIGEAILLRARIASPKLPQLLAERGISSAELPIYDSRCPNYTDEEKLDLALSFTDSHPERIDCIAATSSQAVLHLVEVLQSTEAAHESRWHEQFAQVPIAAIGPKTGQTVNSLGLNLAATAEKATTSALAEAILGYFERN